MRVPIACTAHVKLLAKELHRNIKMVQLPSTETREHLPEVKLTLIQNRLCQAIGYRHLHELNQNITKNGRSCLSEYSEKELIQIRERLIPFLILEYRSDPQVKKDTANAVVNASYHRSLWNNSIYLKAKGADSLTRIAKSHGVSVNFMRGKLQNAGRLRGSIPSSASIKNGWAKVKLWEKDGEYVLWVVWDKSYIARFMSAIGESAFTGASRSKTSASVRNSLRAMTEKLSDLLLNRNEELYGDVTHEAKREMDLFMAFTQHGGNYEVKSNWSHANTAIGMLLNEVEKVDAKISGQASRSLSKLTKRVRAL